MTGSASTLVGVPAFHTYGLGPLGGGGPGEGGQSGRGPAPGGFCPHARDILNKSQLGGLDHTYFTYDRGSGPLRVADGVP